MKKNRLFHLCFSNATNRELLGEFEKVIANKEKKCVVTPNMDILRITYKDEEARKAVNSSDYCTIDGKILFVLNKLFHSNIPENFSGSDIAMPLLDIANKHSARLFIFGGKEGVAKTAMENIIAKYPNVQSAGYSSPIFGFEKKAEVCQNEIKKMYDSQPNIIFLCCGAPKTEKFMHKYYEMFPNALILCLGATVDFIAGNVKRAPKWMSNLGLEWLYRLLQEPKRLYKRYFLDFLFLMKILFFGFFIRNKMKRMYDLDIEEGKKE